MEKELENNDDEHLNCSNSNNSTKITFYLKFANVNSYFTLFNYEDIKLNIICDEEHSK